MDRRDFLSALPCAPGSLLLDGEGGQVTLKMLPGPNGLQTGLFWNNTEGGKWRSQVFGNLPDALAMAERILMKDFA